MESEDYYAALAGTRRGFEPLSTTKCSDCKNEPAMPSNSTCRNCPKHTYVETECFNCETCTEARKYLEDTSDRFTLAGYDQEAEYWKCSQCHHHLAFQWLGPGMMRDFLHYKFRKVHLENICDKIKSGKLECS
jgi:hypothetical protein